MSKRKLLLAGVVICGATLATPVPAQAPVSISADQAKQCAVWASLLSSSMPDEESSQAMIYALNYFVGYYEGAAGLGIGDRKDDDAVLAVALDPESFVQVCGIHMQGYGDRMIAWGEELSGLAASLKGTGK